MTWTTPPPNRQSLETRLRNLEGADAAVQRRRTTMSLVVVGQMLPEGAIKGGSAMALRFGRGSRFTRDVDAALNAAGHEARDWQGGTRIGACLHQFNRDWSRRVLGQGAVVLLITDGLDRDDPALLRTEMERLHLSAKRLIWLNPLLRWDGFAPRAQGIRAMLPHVDTFRASHSVASLEALAQALSDPSDHGEKARLLALLAE